MWSKVEGPHTLFLPMTGVGRFRAIGARPSCLGIIGIADHERCDWFPWRDSVRSHASAGIGILNPGGFAIPSATAGICDASKEER